MLEFKMIQELKPSEELLEIIKNYNYTIKRGKIKHLIAKNYPYTIFVSSKIMEMDLAQQNKVALYLFNSINFNIKNCKSLDNNKQMF